MKNDRLKKIYKLLGGKLPENLPVKELRTKLDQKIEKKSLEKLKELKEKIDSEIKETNRLTEESAVAILDELLSVQAKINSLIKTREDDLATVKFNLKETEKKFSEEIKKIPKPDTTELETKLEELGLRVSTINANRGGSANQKILVGGTWATQRYADINFVIPGAVVSNDDINKTTKIDLTNSTLSDEKVKYDVNDTSAGYLGAKTVAGTGITLAEGTGGDVDKLKITNSAPDQTVAFTGGTNVTIGGTYPNFSITDNSQTSDADLTAIAALGFTSTAFLKKTALNTWALDTNTYLTTADAASTYVELAGDTMSGNLGITKADPEYRLTDSGNSEYMRLLKTDATNYGYLYNRVTVPGGAISPGVLVDAAGEYINNNADPALGQTFTIGGWFKPGVDLRNSVRGLFDTYPSGSGAARVYSNGSGKLDFELGGASALTYTIPADWTNVWKHIVLVKNGATMILYVNGSNVANTTGAGTHTDTKIEIGRYNSGSSFNGAIDEFFAYTRVLTPAEIGDLFNSGTGLRIEPTSTFPSTATSMATNLVRLYHLDENTGTTAVDSSAVASNASLSGGATWTTGIVPTAATQAEATVISSRDGILGAEKGVHTFGDTLGRTVIEGGSIRFSIGGTEQFSIDTSGDLLFPDSQLTYFGTAKDSSIGYDGSDMVVNPKAVGSGIFAISGMVGTEIGSAEAPAHTFIGYRTNGMYLSDPTTVAMSAAGVAVSYWGSSGFQVQTINGFSADPIVITDGSNSNNNIILGGTSDDGNNKLQVNGSVRIGGGAAGTDYALTFDGETNDGVLTWMEDENWFKTNAVIHGATSLYRRYYHIALGAANPGGSGATWVNADANTTGGWRLTNAAWLLRGQADIHADWDGASDMKIGVNFMVNVDNTAGGVGDTVDLKAVIYYKGVGDTATKSQTVEVATTVGQSAQYKQFRAEFTLDWDAVSNVIEVGDVIAIVLNLETDTSEVDDIVVTSMEFSYNTTHLGIESGDI